MSSSPYWHQAPSLRSIMWRIQLMLVPALLFLSAWQGTRWLSNMLYAQTLAMLLEALVLGLRGRAMRSAWDGSIALSALLLVLSLPLTAPLWLLSVAVGVMVLAKQLYGGLGMNPFNPAMVAFVFCLLSFPASMNQHSQEALVWTTLWQNVDAITGATLLDTVRQARLEALPLAVSISWHVYVLHGFYLLAAVLLARWRMLDLRITLAVLTSAFFTAFLLHWTGQALLSAWQQLHAGALFLGACFIATDPVTAATTVRGRWFYGALIGFLTVAVRVWGQFPDGMALAVLIANACAPFLDRFCRPRYV